MTDNKKDKKPVTEEQKLAALEKKVRLQRTKMSAQDNKRKILWGVYFLDLLDQGNIEGVDLLALKKYVANNIEGFLTRPTDQAVMKDRINALKKEVDQASINPQTHPEYYESSNNYEDN